jgi:alternate signal-mediated exported protein
MQKISKGIVALGAGLALTLGGVGSLAYWQTTQNTSPLEFATGDISLTAGVETWYLNGVDLDFDSWEDARTLEIVPGDTLVYTETFDVVTNGTDITAALDVQLGDLTAVTGGADSTAAFAGKLTPTFSFDGIDGWNGVQHTTTPGTYNITGSGTAELAVALAWPFGAAGSDGTSTMDAQLTLGSATVTLRQVPSALPIAVG